MDKIKMKYLPHKIKYLIVLQISIWTQKHTKVCQYSFQKKDLRSIANYPRYPTKYPVLCYDFSHIIKYYFRINSFFYYETKFGQLLGPIH